MTDTMNRAVQRLWLGDSEGSPPNWGGEPRVADIVGIARLPSGAPGTVVRIDPPLPRSDGPPLDEAILMPHAQGDDLERLGEGSMVVNVLRPVDGVDISRPSFADGELVIQFWADAATTREGLPKPLDEAAFWQETLARIRRFIEQHGHSNVPPGYSDQRGPLDIIVGNIRWHHAGKGGASPGPFPGIDYAAELDRLPGWHW
jgi:hypothetical protein